MSADYTIVAVPTACLADVLAILSGAAANTAAPALQPAAGTPAEAAQWSPVSHAAMEAVVVQILPNGQMNAKSAALYLGRSEKTMASWRHLHVGPKWTKVSGRVRYSRDDLDNFVKSGADVSTRRDNGATTIAAGLELAADRASPSEELGGDRL
jgi:hypothetical protein